MANIVPFYSEPVIITIIRALYEIIKYIIKLWFKTDKTNYSPLHVAIVGSKGAGKTTLWSQLQSKMSDYDYTPTDTCEIKSFKVSYGDKTVDIASSLDIGGDDLFVEDYEKLIKHDDTLVYFLIDLLRIEETRQEILARLRKITEILKEKQLDNCKVKILATNLGKYKTLGYEEKYGLPLKYVKSKIGISKFAKLMPGLSEIILPIELTDDAQIAIIKSEIIKERI